MEGTVLILDDDQQVREGLKALLEHTGLVVHTTQSLLEFHSLAAQHDPDLVLVDIRMAGLKGDAIVSVARSRLKSSKVVLFSGISRAELEERSRACGADGFLSKMDDTEEILKQVLSWVEQRRRLRGHAN
jgi:DNA-binding NarL/FixJ family response regulator